jgi:valyl-tRNA synthetase
VPTTHATLHLAGADVYVDLAGVIDVAAETQRLAKQLEKLSGMIAAKEKKLANRSFIDKAPADVVRNEEESLAQLRQQLATARDSLAALGTTPPH